MEQKQEKIFVDGMNVKLPSKNAPTFILLQAGFNATKFFRWCQTHQDEKGWVNITIKKSQQGNIYAELDSWKPNKSVTNLADVQEAKERQGFTPDVSLENIDSDIPF